MTPAVPNVCLHRKVFMKHRFHWGTVSGAVHEVPWRSTCTADNPVGLLNEQLSLLVCRFMPTKVIHVHDKDMLKFINDLKHAFKL